GSAKHPARPPQGCSLAVWQVAHASTRAGSPSNRFAYFSKQFPRDGATKSCGEDSCLLCRTDGTYFPAEGATVGLLGPLDGSPLLAGSRAKGPDFKANHPGRGERAARHQGGDDSPRSGPQGIRVTPGAVDLSHLFNSRS